jgi:hypothetical protein
MAVFKVFQQHLVNPGQNIIELQLHGSEAAHLSPGECHEQCGAEAMPFGIGYGDQKRTIRHEDEIEIISLAGCAEPPMSKPDTTGAAA